MQVENALWPSREQLEAFASGGDAGPIVMVNLLKFRERAEYPDGSDGDLSGEEAYRRYAAGMKQLLEAAGGSFVFGGRVQNLLIGEVEAEWDYVGLAQYPSPAAMLRISSSPEFREIEVHRQAGLAGQLNITTSIDPFGE
jgi:uncharacterized protein (DUF1330 family)